jgi:DNA-binding SARP family transcriptional activator
MPEERATAPHLRSLPPADDALAAPLRIRLFGALAFEHGVRDLGPRDFGGVKPKQVLEILLAERGRPVPKDRLADRIWGEDLPRNVEATLETYVSLVRRALGSRARSLLKTESRAYRFAAEAAELDLDRFDALVAQAAGAPPAIAREALEEALALAARGEVLEDEPYAAWIQPLRANYTARVLAARLEASRLALAFRDFPAALEHAEAALASDRFSEPAHRAVMLALYALGRQNDALDAYGRCRSALDELLGLEPLVESRALQGAILRQVDVDELLPPAVPQQVQPGHLGRSAELARIDAALRAAAAGSFAFVLVEGEAGSGKSRLVDEAARRLPSVRIGRAACLELERRLPYVPLLSALRDALGDDLPGTDAAVAGLDELALLESIVRVVQAAGPTVLVLDDLHLADEQSLAALAYLRRRCAGTPLAILASAGSGDHALGSLPTLRVTLEPLSPDELAPLAIADLHERTGGHPQLVAAVLGAKDRDELARRLGPPLLARCRDAGPFAYRLLLAASIFEQPFEPDALADLLGADPLAVAEELDRLCELRLLRADGFGFRFRFGVLREVLELQLSPARRRALGRPRPLAAAARLAG